jgi:hypothetical protein
MPGQRAGTEARARKGAKVRRDAGCGIQDTGYRIQDTGYRIQDTGYRIQETSIPNIE